MPVTVLAREPATRADIIEAILHLRRDCGRMTCADPRYAGKHARLNDLLTALEATP